MAVLRGRGVPPVALTLGVAILASCVLYERLAGKDDALAFSHRVHVEDEGLDCLACHAGAETDEPGLPVQGQCMLCHEDTDAEAPPERRVATLFDADGAYLAQRFSALSDETLFSHALHAEAAGDCAVCHTGIEESERVDAGLAVTMDECSKCHAALGAPNECATCHSRLGPEGAPSSHGANWTRTHGKVFRSGSKETANRCDLCHQESSCSSCHFDTPPENHTNYWRRRGHGITARMDRDSCAACHRSDSCERCHSENTPVSHNGSWGGVKNRHCLSCHLNTQEGGCFVCHQGTPSHSQATPLPPDHTPGMFCLQCHGITAPLPHVNKGDDCVACHQ